MVGQALAVAQVAFRERVLQARVLLAGAGQAVLAAILLVVAVARVQ